MNKTTRECYINSYYYCSQNNDENSMTIELIESVASSSSEENLDRSPDRDRDDSTEFADDSTIHKPSFVSR